MSRPSEASPLVSWQSLTLNLRNPFVLSYGATDQRRAFWLRLREDEGWGEGTIPPYYRVDPSAMIACWQAANINERDRSFPASLQEIDPWMSERGLGILPEHSGNAPKPAPAPARSAIDLALHDRLAKKAGLPLYRFLDLPRPPAMATSFTISIETPEKMAEMARQIADYPIIKLKLGSDDDESRVRAVREARPDAKIRVDANAGWSLEQAIEHLKWLQKYDLELIEQPLPREQLAEMGELQKHTRIPIIADESVQSLGDVEELGAAGVAGINLKLMKVGGLGPALRILKRARELKMRIMLGCMIETSLGTTAMAHLAGLAEWIDLDAPLLISNDPFDGIRYDEHARINVPDRPGIGVIRRPIHG